MPGGGGGRAPCLLEGSARHRAPPTSMGGFRPVLGTTHKHGGVPPGIGHHPQAVRPTVGGQEMEGRAGHEDPVIEP